LEAEGDASQCLGAGDANEQICYNLDAEHLARLFNELFCYFLDAGGRHFYAHARTFRSLSR